MSEYLKKDEDLDAELNQAFEQDQDLDAELNNIYTQDTSLDKELNSISSDFPVENPYNTDDSEEKGYLVAPEMARQTAEKTVTAVEKGASGLIDMFTPEGTADVYKYAKEGKSVYSPTLTKEFEASVARTSENFLNKLKSSVKEVGDRIGELRSSGGNIDVTNALKEIKNSLESEIQYLPDAEQQSASRKLNKEFENLTKKIEKESLVLKKPKSPITENPIEETVNKLQKQLDEYRLMSSKQGIKTTEPLIEQVGQSFIGKVDEVPQLSSTGEDLVSQESMKKSVLQFSEKTKPESIDLRKKEFAKLNELQGKKVIFKEPVKVGSKIMIPTEIVSEVKPKELLSITKKAPFPTGISNPIEFETNKVIEQVLDGNMSYDDMYKFRSNLQRSLDNIKDTSFQKIIKEQLGKLGELENKLDQMPELKSAYRQQKLIAEEIPGLSGYFGTSQDFGDMYSIPKGMETPAKLQEFIAKQAINKELDALNFKGGSVEKGLQELQSMTKPLDLNTPPPTVSQSLEELDDITKRFVLGKKFKGEVDSIKYAAPNVARGEITVAAAKAPGRIADVLGKNAKVIEPALKGAKVATKVGLPVLAVGMVAKEAADADLSPQDVAAYTAAITGVDLATVGGSAAAGSVVPGVGTAIGAGVGSTLTALREVDAMINPDKAKNLLTMYKKLKAEGKSTAEAAAAVAAKQSELTIKSPVNIVRNTFSGTILERSPESVLEQIQDNPKYQAYVPRIQELTTMSEDERKRILVTMQSEPAFRQMMKDVLNQRVEKGTFMPPKRLGE